MKGWFGESWRHMLAAKGVKTYQASKYDKNLPPSIIERDWKSVKEFTKESADTVKQRWKDAKEERLEKQRAKEQEQYDYWKKGTSATEKELKEYQYWRR